MNTVSIKTQNTPRKLGKAVKLMIILAMAIILPMSAVMIACTENSDILSVNIHKASFEMTVGQVAKFEAEVESKKEGDKNKLRWESSDSQVVEVNRDTGEVTAKKVGKATVRAVSTVDTKMFGTVGVTVVRPANEQFLDDWDSMINYDANQIAALDQAGLVELYNDMVAMMNELDSVMDKIESTEVAEFFGELQEFFKLYEKWDTKARTELGQGIKAVIDDIDSADQKFVEIDEEIYRAMFNENITTQTIEGWNTKTTELETQVQGINTSLTAIESNLTGLNEVEKLYVTIMRERLGEMQGEVNSLKEFVDWVQPSSTSTHGDSLQSQVEQYEEKFGISPRFGRSKRHWWGQEIFLSNKETSDLVIGINIGSASVGFLLGLIPVVGKVLKVVTKVSYKILGLALKLNNGPNGVKIHLSWIQLGYVFANPLMAAIPIAAGVRRG